MPRGRKIQDEPQVTPEKLVRLAKTNIGHSEAAAELGVTVGQISSLQWSHALVEAGRYSKMPATTANVKKMRTVEENRWELIAARIGESVARVKELFGEEAAAVSSVKRGRKATETAAPAAKTGGRKSAAATAATPRRARTRAERAAAKANNPS
jgi:hypothetical protein